LNSIKKIIVVAHDRLGIWRDVVRSQTAARKLRVGSIAVCWDGNECKNAANLTRDAAAPSCTCEAIKGGSLQGLGKSRHHLGMPGDSKAVTDWRSTALMPRPKFASARSHAPFEFDPCFAMLRLNERIDEAG